LELSWLNQKIQGYDPRVSIQCMYAHVMVK
jgi:hypothetical protein